MPKKARGGLDCLFEQRQKSTQEGCFFFGHRRRSASAPGEILLTSMDCDGQKTGYDLELTRQVSERVGIPVIASGGAALEHFLKAFTEGRADAVLAASFVSLRRNLHSAAETISEGKSNLRANLANRHSLLSR